MPLIDLWKNSRSQLEGKNVQQLVAIAGAGKLLDGGDASEEFREFLSSIPSALLSRYAAECLTDKFEGSGFALQDVVNQIGRRLGFRVEDGRYRGIAGQSGHDGLWRSSFADEIIVEVKTTDAYRVPLDAIAEYRKRLIQEGKVTEAQSSVLVVVGRQDTGELEAQIHGSRHAWDVRLVSIDALVRLMLLKETVEDPQMLKKITGVLVPEEFTKVDAIIDLVFSAAEEIRQDVEGSEVQEDLIIKRDKRTPQFVPADFHDACIHRIEKHLGRSLLKQTRATYSSPDGSLIVVCAVSRTHTRGMYWYAFHPYQKEKLESAKEAYVAYGCGSENTVLFIQFTDFAAWLEGMWITQQEDRFYWHVSIRQENARMLLRRKKGFSEIDLTKYLIK